MLLLFSYARCLVESLASFHSTVTPKRNPHIFAEHIQKRAAGIRPGGGVIWEATHGIVTGT